MDIPLAVTFPLALAASAYANAKFGLWYDRLLLSATIPASWQSKYRQWQDRVNLFYQLERLALNPTSAQRKFLIYQGRSWSYGTAYDTVLRCGNYLWIQHGVRMGDVVVLDLVNSDYFVLICLGLWSIGAKPAFINYNVTGAALAHCVKLAKGKVMIVDSELEKAVNSCDLGELKIQFLTEEFVENVKNTEATRMPDSVRTGQLSRDMAILIYTSGTTGLPKAAIVSWGKLIIASTFVRRWLTTGPSDTFYTCMPLYHSTAAILGFAHVLEAGAALAIGRRFSNKTFWEEVRATNATMIQYVGETCRYLLAAPPEIDPTTGDDMDRRHKVRLAFGNGLRSDVWERFRDRFGIDTIAEFYGATEAHLATWNLNRNSFSAGAIGRAGIIYESIMNSLLAIVKVDLDADHMPVMVRDAHTGFCRQMPRGQVGELLLVLARHDIEQDFQGYYGNQRATDEKIVWNVFSKGDAYFRTGDLVSWDRAGRIYFHDRIGDTFRWKSENVATTEVSQVLSTHPMVQEANVYGVSLPHHDGRAGCAAIVLAPQFQKDWKGAQEERHHHNENKRKYASLADLGNHAKRYLPRYAVPQFVRVVRDLKAMTTGTNKQQKYQLRVQGVDPTKVGEDEVFWLREGKYVRFKERDWKRLDAGQVKL